MNEFLSGKVAIAGIGATEFSKESGRTEMRLAVEATLAALADAGIDPAEVDGMCTFTMDHNPEVEVHNQIGGRELTFFSRIDYGGGGEIKVEVVNVSGRRGVRLEFSDKGPGIPDLEKALTDGYTTGGGLGLGLSGAKRLVNEFDIKSAPGQGTVITLIRWKA